MWTQEAELRVSPQGVTPEPCSFPGPMWSRERRQFWVRVLQGIGEPGQSWRGVSVCCPGGLVQRHLQEARKRPSGEKGVYPDILVVRDVERKLGRGSLGNSNSVRQKVGPMAVTTSGRSSPVTVEMLTCRLISRKGNNSDPSQVPDC